LFEPRELPRRQVAQFLFQLNQVGFYILAYHKRTRAGKASVIEVFYHGRARRSPAWDCGYPFLNARMQDSAEGFGQPVKVVFQPAFRIEGHAPSPLDARPRYSESAEDRLWYWLYLPVARAVDRATTLVTVLQRGRISVYLMYSFATLLVLLFFVR